MSTPSFMSLLEAQLAELKQASFVTTVVQGKSNPRPSAPIDRITLKIPYCKSTLKWRLLLFPDQPHVPPDFLLGKGEEGRIDITTLKSLKNWDIRQPRSLLEVVSEMLNIYKDSQKQSVLAFPSERIHFEVSVVQDRPGVEFLLTNSSDYGAEIRLVVPLDIQEARNPTQRGENKPCLFVAWRPDVKDTPTTSLITNPHLDNILGEMQMPTWHADMCLMDYIPAVEAVIRDGISDYAYRKAFVQQCIITLGRCVVLKGDTMGRREYDFPPPPIRWSSPLEYDSTGFSKIVYLLGDESKPPASKDKDIFMVAILTLPLCITKDKPSIILQSVIPGKGGKPIARSAGNFPWVSRAPAEEAIKKLRTFFADVRGDFVAAVETELKQIADG